MAPTPASEPFNGSNNSADIIIRSSDKVDFYVHKLILGLASPFFRDMFSLTQPMTSTTGQGDTHSADSPPVIDATEDGKTLDRMLRFIYPVAEPPPGTLDEVAQVLEASLKYQVDKIVLHAKAALRSFADKRPLHVFAIACRLNLEEEARLAANIWKVKHVPKLGCTCLPVNFSSRQFGFLSTCDKCNRDIATNFAATIAGASFPKEMETVNAGSYHRLMQSVHNEQMGPFCNPKHCLGEEEEVHVAPMFNRSDADLILQSSDGLQFRVHKLLLSLTSAHSMLEKVNEDTPTEDGLPLVQLDERGLTLSHLLRFCYPFQEDWTISLPQGALVRVAAEKYALPNVAIQARKQMMGDVQKHPIQAYLLFRLYGWEEDTQQALKECFKLTSIGDESSYVPEMEESPAIFYRDLLKAHFDNSLWKDRNNRTWDLSGVTFSAGQSSAWPTTKKRRNR